MVGLIMAKVKVWKQDKGFHLPLLGSDMWHQNLQSYESMFLIFIYALKFDNNYDSSPTDAPVKQVLRIVNTASSRYFPHSTSLTYV
jgi:hypothetical protein